MEATPVSACEILLTIAISLESILIMTPSLMDVHRAVPQTPLVLHGTHGVSDELFQEIMKYGVVKINLNRTVRDEYTHFIAQNAGKLELTTLKMRGVEIYARSIERAMTDFLKSAGKA